MVTLKVRIASYEEIKARSMAEAEGECQAAHVKSILWFPSAESFAKIFSAANRELLSVIHQKAPCSLVQLSNITGRSLPYLSRSLRTLAKHGLVKLDADEQGRLMPKVTYDKVQVELAMCASRRGR